MEKFSYIENYNKSRKKTFTWFKDQILSKSIINEEKKMENTIDTIIFIDGPRGETRMNKVKYNFEKNCWIIEKETTINEAIEIANELKRKYYNKKQWVISWANKKIEVRFVNEMEHI